MFVCAQFTNFHCLSFSVALLLCFYFSIALLLCFSSLIVFLLCFFSLVAFLLSLSSITFFLCVFLCVHHSILPLCSFTLASPVCKCWGQHSCMSSTFLCLTDGIYFFRREIVFTLPDTFPIKKLIIICINNTPVLAATIFFLL